jgi:hypothetical protein
MTNLIDAMTLRSIRPDERDALLALYTHLPR